MSIELEFNELSDEGMYLESERERVYADMMIARQTIYKGRFYGVKELLDLINADYDLSEDITLADESFLMGDNEQGAVLMEALREKACRIMAKLIVGDE